VSGARVAAVGVLTGWGEGIGALPDDAERAAAGRPILPRRIPPRPGERFRRATRECLLGLASVEAMLEDGGLGRDAIAGDRSALVFVTAAAYGSANRAFIESTTTGAALHFPYTAPSAVPAEVAIEFRLTGPYVILIGGAAATVDALWQASTLVERGVADRAVVLAVETFEECGSLYARGRWLSRRPLVEAAASALLVAAREKPVYRRSRAARAGMESTRRRAGETLACEPLISLALARQRGHPTDVSGQWRGQVATLSWPAVASQRD